MVAVKKTSEIITNSNKAENNARLFVTRKSDARQIVVDWKNKHEIHWKDYQIKETDPRSKTATFSSPNYFDATTGVYCILIETPTHEEFAGEILTVDYDEKSGLYDYECQDFSRTYQSKFELINGAGKSNHHLLLWLITRGGFDFKKKPSKAVLKKYSKVLAGLRPAYQYEQKAWGSTISFNPMTANNKSVYRNKSWIQTIRDIVYGTKAYIDVYFDRYGIIHIEPYHKNDLYESGLLLTTPEIANLKYRFDSTNIITGVIVHNTNKLKGGSFYSSESLVNLDLSAIFGSLATSIDNPNTSTTTTNSVSDKRATSSTKTSNIYGTKKKVVYLSIDDINNKTSDRKKLTDMAKLLKKQGWKTKIMGVGPSTHYARRNEIKKGIWFCLYGGACAGTLREHCTSSWFLNPLKKNKSRVVVGFFPPAGNIRKGGKYYGHLPPAHDWTGNRQYANIKNPAEFLSKNGVPFMYANNPSQMVAKFLAGGDNLKKYAGGWKKHDVKWI